MLIKVFGQVINPDLIQFVDVLKDRVQLVYGYGTNAYLFYGPDFRKDQTELLEEIRKQIAIERQREKDLCLNISTKKEDNNA